MVKVLGGSGAGSRVDMPCGASWEAIGLIWRLDGVRGKKYANSRPALQQKSPIATSVKTKLG